MMARPARRGLRWKTGETFSLRVKGDLWVLGQMLVSPFMLFFNRFERFAEGPKWQEPPHADEVLFPAAVTRQFLRFADLRRETLPGIDYTPPTAWIAYHHGGRKVILWPGTEHERSTLVLSQRPGGRLFEQHIGSGAGAPRPTLMAEIPLNDDATIDGHELDVIRLFPNLNERLYLCHIFGRNVDPEKDITFDRELPSEYRTYVDIRSQHGSLEDWGYGDMRPPT
ncbi:MAG: hypothetical protein HC927_00965 [Deltaproteobacteria bacterium]|nr:hypothetical protein [Deltaproteobacteria bacterium]